MADTRKKLLTIASPYKKTSASDPKKTEGIPAKKQAEALLTTLLTNYNSNSKNIAITYAANDNQTNAIRKAQAEGQFLEDLVIGGSGQAAVFSEMIKLLKDDKKYESLKGCIHVLPVATSLTGGNDTSWPDNQTKKYHAVRDLAYIAAHLNSNNYNTYLITDPHNRDRPAIGGGNSVNWPKNKDTGEYVFKMLDEFKEKGATDIYTNCDLDFEVKKELAAEEIAKYLDSWSVVKHHKGRAQADYWGILVATTEDELKRMTDFAVEGGFKALTSDDLQSKGLSGFDARFFTEKSKRGESGRFDQSVEDAKKKFANNK